MQDSVSVGTRFCASSGHLGTIKYIGAIDGTQGIWYGVEWDDPGRGKHDGVRDGRRYFACRIHNAGSFIRPSNSLCFGVSFLSALTAKYDEEPDPSEVNILFGTATGAVQVEAVGFDQVRKRLRAVERLRHVSLDNRYVASGDPPGRIRATCPNIRELDLSANLLTCWHTVASISAELPRLERLTLNRNRFLTPQPSTATLTHIVELQLNDTLITWEEFNVVASFIPGLKVVELGYNRLASLAGAKPSTPLANIQSLNFDTNMLADWPSTASALSGFVSLHRLVLSCNDIREIGLPQSEESPLLHVRSLVLSGNQLHDWSAIDALPRWCPNLESLSLAGNPLIEVGERAPHARQFIIARIPTLRMLDLTTISQKERTDSERFYLSFVAKNVPGDDEARRSVHPQWNALCQKHGNPVEPSGRRDEDKLSRLLISINIYRCSTPPSNRVTCTSPSTSIKVLSTMKIRAFRLKLIKTFRLRPSVVSRVWLRMQDGFVELVDDGTTLDWFGIDNESDIFLSVTEQSE